MNFRRWFPLLFALGLALTPAARAQVFHETPQLTATLVADTAAVQAGKVFTAGVRVVIQPEWYIYWRFVGDIGVATSVVWELPPGWKVGELQWPLPVSHEAAGDFLNYVYEREVLLFAEITPPATLPSGPVTLKAKVAWQACNPRSCVPGETTLALELPAGPPAPANAELFAAFRARLPRESGAPFTVEWDRAKAGSFALRVTGLGAKDRAEFFPIPPDGVVPEHPTTSEIAADGARTITFPVGKGAAANLPWRGVLAVQKDGGPREGWLLDAAMSAASRSFETAAAPAAHRSAPQRNLFAILWSAFLGGLILNLMPCVLPVIALKIFSFVQQAGEEPRRVFRLGLAFVAGVFTFFLGLATLIAVLRANGIGLNWGFQFQHVGVLVTLIALVFVFGLNLLGVFEIALGGGAAGKLSELSSREGYGGAFLHGMFTTLLGTSCTAPFLGAVLGFAFVAPVHVILLIFTAIATGMSLPYFLLTANPAWMRFLPKPGAWMERLKQFMGFIMLAVVVWLLGVFTKGRIETLGVIGGIEALTGLSGLLVAVAIACWIAGSFERTKRAWIAMLIVTAAGISFVHLKLKPIETGIVWQPWSEARVAEATKAGQPVFINFTADWCLNCKYNEKFVLETAPVRAALKAKNVLPLKADFTNRDPAIAAILARFDRAGVPLYILYSGGATEPVLLPEILTQNSLLTELDRIKN